MITLNVVEVVNRGLESGLPSLTPRERDAFVLVDLDNYCEMEGEFVDHLANAPELADWLSDALRRIGDISSYSIIQKLRGGSRQQASALYERYLAGREFRLQCLDRYLRTEGFELAWT